MKKDPRLDENRVRFIWEQAIIPYIEEQCFGNEEKLKEFALRPVETGARRHGPQNPMPEAASRKARWMRATGSLRMVATVHRLELKEHEMYRGNVSLDREQLGALTNTARIEVTPSPDEDGA